MKAALIAGMYIENIVGELKGLKYRRVQGVKMYCSSCGAAVIKDLNYCKHCGAKLSGAKERGAGKLSEDSFIFLIACIIGIPIAGLGIVIGLMEVMKKEIGFSNELILVFTSLSFLLLLAAESVFIWLLLNRTRAVKETGDKAGSKKVTIKELAEPAPSVTENTTAFIEPLHSESKTK